MGREPAVGAVYAPNPSSLPLHHTALLPMRNHRLKMALPSSPSPCRVTHQFDDFDEHPVVGG